MNTLLKTLDILAGEEDGLPAREICELLNLPSENLPAVEKVIEALERDCVITYYCPDGEEPLYIITDLGRAHLAQLSVHS